MPKGQQESHSQKVTCFHMYRTNPTHVISEFETQTKVTKPNQRRTTQLFSLPNGKYNGVNLNPHHHHPTATISPIMLAAASTWLRARRSRYLFLLLCSPILLPLLCATLPLLCAAELCFRLIRRHKKASRGAQAEEEENEEEAERLGRCEEGRGGCAKEDEKHEVGLLQRYLEDQLLLVGSVYDCGDEDDEDLYHEIHRHCESDTRTPLLS